MQKQKLNQRQLQAIRTKNKLFKTAINLFEKHGFDNTTIKEISKKANVSVGVFYHYFKSKNDIFFEIYKVADDYFQTEVSKLLDKDSSTKKILQYFYYYAKYNHDRGVEFIKLLYNPSNKRFIAKGRYLQVLLEEIIREGQEKGEIVQDITPEQICNELFIIARGIVYNWCLHDGDYDLVDYLTSFIKRAILIYIPPHSSD